MRERAATNVKYALDSRTKLFIKCNVHAATVVVPRNLTDPKCAAIVLDLGHITVNTDLKPRVSDQDMYLSPKP